MSFGKKKMWDKCTDLAHAIKACDHRGMEWIVVTDGGFYYGTSAANGPGNETFAPILARVDDHFKPWAKKLLRNYLNLQPKEAEPCD